MSEDCYGLRWSCMLPRDKAGAATFASQAHLVIAPAAHVSKAVATLHMPLPHKLLPCNNLLQRSCRPRPRHSRLLQQFRWVP